MGIFDAFTGAPAIKAAKQTEELAGNAYQRNRGTALNTSNAQRNALQGRMNNAVSYLGQGYNAGTGAINDGATGALGYLDQGYGDAIGAAQGVGNAYQPLQSLSAKYGAGTDLYQDALGINGATGNERATQAFTTGPGYQFQMDQALDAINRRRAAGGMLGSGNADVDAMQYASGLASQEYGNWLDRLGGMMSPELAATSGAAAGMAGGNQLLSSLYANEGTAKAGIESGRGGALASLAERYFGNQADLETDMGIREAQIYGNEADRLIPIEERLFNAVSGAKNQKAQAQMQGSANMLGFGMNLANLGARAMMPVPGGAGAGG